MKRRDWFRSMLGLAVAPAPSYIGKVSEPTVYSRSYSPEEICHIYRVPQDKISAEETYRSLVLQFRKDKHFRES